MFELLFTSFPVIIRYYQLKRRGEEMTVWNMRTAMFMWAALAFTLFLLIFYFHPKSYSGLLPFRTVSVVAQTAGPVTEVKVRNGQRVSTGDILFRIESSSQRAALKQAEAQLGTFAAASIKAEDTLKVALATVAQIQATLDEQLVDLSDAQTLFDRNVGSQDAVQKLDAAVKVSQAQLQAAQAQVHVAQTDIDETIPAQIKTAEAAVEAATAALAKTEVHTYTDGTVTQLSLSPGSPASTLILSPAMLIIPDRADDVPVRFIAGFSQVARATLYEGMPAEIACDSNANMSFRNSVLPAKVAFLQPAIPDGQVMPGSKLLDPSNITKRGSIMVYLELVHPEHTLMVMDGAGCIIQTYTNNLPGISGHVIAATGVIKAVGLRLKVWGSLISGVGLAGGGGH